MVAPTWLLMSSPTIGTPASVNFCGPHRVAGDEDGDGVDEGHLGVQAGLGVVLLGLLAADRKVGDQHVGAASGASASATSTGSSGDSSMVWR